MKTPGSTTSLRFKRRLPAGLFASLLLGLAAAPEQAFAHGIGGQSSLGFPSWIVVWVGAIALIGALAAFERGWRPLQSKPTASGAPVAFAGVARVGLGMFGVGMLALVVWSGLTQVDDVRIGSSLPMISSFGLLWLGLPLLSLLFGDVWRSLSPWRALAELFGFLARKLAGEDELPKPLEFPRLLGYWPAVLTLFAFASLAVAASGFLQISGKTVAFFALLYTVLMLSGTAFFGSKFLDRCEGLGAYFKLVSSLSPLAWRGGGVTVRRPGSGLTQLVALPELAIVALLPLAATLFDGFASTDAWGGMNGIGTWLIEQFNSLRPGGAFPFWASQAAGLLLGVLILLALCWVTAILVLRTRSTPPLASAAEVASGIAVRLIAVVAGYQAVHYLTLLFAQLQTFLALLSDPRLRGEDLFGTRDWNLNPLLPDSTPLLYAQLVFLLVVHVAALIAICGDHEIFGGTQPKRTRVGRAWIVALLTLLFATSVSLLVN